MSILTYNKEKSKHPFYFYEGKGWKIETKIKLENGAYIKVSKCWFKTKRDAENAFPRVIEERKRKLSENSSISRAFIGWGKFSDRYIDFRRTQIKAASLAVDKNRLSAFFDPIFDGLYAKDCFKREMAVKVQERALNKKCSRAEKNKTLSMYLKMLEFAFDHEYLEDDSDYRKCKTEIHMFGASEENEVPKNEKVVITLDQQEALLNAIADPKDKMLTLLLCETGARVSEALALTVGDFDPLARTIHIHSTVSRDEFGCYRVYNRTKTPLGNRRIPITEAVSQILASYIEAYALDDDDYLFASKEAESGVLEYTAYKKRLTKYCKTAGIPVITPHCLRHTFATRLSESCRTDAERQARAYIMGHSIIVDEQTYTAHNQLAVAKTLIG